MNYAYVTLLSSKDYLPAVLILNTNLKAVCAKYPLVIGVTENIADYAIPYLEKENITYKLIPFMEYSQKTQQKWTGPASTLNIASKFALFKFYEYDKLVYIDADILIYKNIDELFDYPDGAMYDDNGSPFIGLFVFIPENHNVDFYYLLTKILNTIESNILETLFFPFKSNLDYRIPFKYYVNITYDNLDNFNLNDISVVHFCYRYKPWKYAEWSSYIVDYTKAFPEAKNNNKNRIQIVSDYFEKYYINLLKKYPEFKQYQNN